MKIVVIDPSASRIFQFLYCVLLLIVTPLALAVDPGTPTNLTAMPDDGQGAIEAYNVYRCEGAGCVIDADTDWLAWVTTVTTYTDRGTADKPFISGTTHRYAVATYRDEEGNWSNEVEAVAQGGPSLGSEEPEMSLSAQTPAVPGEPTGLTGTSAAGVTLNWTAPTVTGSSALTGYNVYRCIDDTTSCTPAWLGWVVSGTTYTDSDVTANTTYRYTVEACNGTGCENRSDEITVMTGDTVNQQLAGNQSNGTMASEVQRNQTVPSVPTDLTSFSAGASSIQLSWIGDATNGYDVYRCIGSETCTPVAWLGWTYADDQATRTR